VLPREDLKALAQLGHALWAMPAASDSVTTETLGALSLRESEPTRLLERTSTLLLERAVKDGIRANLAAADQPFYRLQPEERLILVALHANRWSYARLARILGKTSEQIEETAWAARLHLISVPGRQIAAPHPTGSKFSGERCPEYSPARPWTQRFLDDELGRKERFFLENHLVSCETCGKAMARCRQLYFAVGSMLPHPSTESQSVRRFVKALHQSAVLARPSQARIRDLIWSYVERRKTAFGWVALGFAVLVLFLRK
jgi:hypothetical protein